MRFRSSKPISIGIHRDISLTIGNDIAGRDFEGQKLFLKAFIGTFPQQLGMILLGEIGWNSVELSKLKEIFTYLDILQWTLKSSHKDIHTTVFVLCCRRNAKQIEAHSSNIV